jgi:5-methylcytosine-specific restriction endonuclease McrA
MIRIDHNKIQVPEIIQSLEFKDFIRQMLLEKRYMKKETYHRPLSDRLNESHNKCAYCESPVNRAGYYLTMDHYRPKDKLMDDDSHPGYYWLGYEWTNLLPACPKCNSKKSNRFPIQGKRVTGPPMSNGELDLNCCKANSPVHLEEEPLLLHPAIDFPGEHLVFNGSGEIKGLTDRGNETIAVLGLDRIPLNLERKKLVDDYYSKIKKLLEKIGINKQKAGIEESDEPDEPIPPQFEEIFAEIKKSGEPGKPYSLMGCFLFKNFEEFVIERLKQEIGEKAGKFLRRAFTNFLETN